VDRKPVGEPIPNYYPAAVQEADWLAARAGLAQRRSKHGRKRAEMPNLFAKLLYGAHNGKPYHVIMRQHGTDGAGRRTKAPMLIAADTSGPRGPGRTFPMPAFEAAILSCLREIDPHEILNGDQGPDETIELAAQLAGIEAEIADAKAFMDANGFNAIIGQRIMDLDAKKLAWGARLADARHKAAHPLSESWGEMQSLAAVLENAPDPIDARLRLKAAVQRVVESVWVLIVPRGGTRLAAVQVYFAGKGRRRDYLLMYRQARGNGITYTPGGWWARSLASMPRTGDLDLRSPKDVAKLEKFLLALDLATADVAAALPRG
jgi:hypothetical protein